MEHAWWLTDIRMWSIGVPFLVLAEVLAALWIERLTGRFSTQRATLDMLKKLAKRRGYKRIAKQAIEGIQETISGDTKEV